MMYHIDCIYWAETSHKELTLNHNWRSMYVGSDLTMTFVEDSVHQVSGICFIFSVAAIKD